VNRLPCRSAPGAAGVTVAAAGGRGVVASVKRGDMVLGNPRLEAPCAFVSVDALGSGSFATGVGLVSGANYQTGLAVATPSLCP
jgi:hypothetical protein